MGILYTKPMRWAQGGYTVVEVMIFLMISAVIFFGAVSVFQGQQGKTAFEQGMRDFSSQLQKYVDEVSTSVFLGGSDYACTVSSSTNRSILSVGAPGLGTNQECIFLGRAIQVIPAQQTIYIYSVLGNKSAANGEPVTSFAAANPEPAMSTGTDLTEEYFTSWGKVTSSQVIDTSGAASDSNLVGFYNSLQDGYQNSGVSGAQSVFAKGYNYQSTDPESPRSEAIRSCIEEQNANGVTCAVAPIINSWNICFASTGSNQTASLIVTSQPAGISTEINFASCT